MRRRETLEEAIVGRNAEIKRFTATRRGQPLDLFESRASRAPVLSELFASPWIVRASELMGRDGGSAPKRAAEKVTVEWDPYCACPRAFVRGGRRFRVDAVLQSWSSERAWWDPRRRVSQRHWRVLARDGVYDLTYDLIRDAWRLTGIHD